MTERYPEIDVVKATAIVAVVLIHSLRPFWEPGFTQFEALVSDFTRFAVPGFLAASGFLYYQAQPVTLLTLARRLRRVLLPYLCASLAAYVYTLAYPRRCAAASFFEGLIFGSIFGPYYYVFLLTEFVVATWLLSRLPQRAVLGLLTVLVTAISVRIAFFAAGEGQGLTAVARNPALWGPWFLLGWIAAAYRQGVMRATSQYRRPILLGWALAVAAWLILFWAGTLRGRAGHLVMFGLVAANLIGLFALARGIARAPRLVVDLSNRTYALYLLHPFFVYAFQDIAQPALSLSLLAQVLLAWGAGLFGAVLVTVAAQRVLGERSRDIVGA